MVTGASDNVGHSETEPTMPSDVSVGAKLSPLQTASDDADADPNQVCVHTYYVLS